MNAIDRFLHKLDGLVRRFTNRFRKRPVCEHCGIPFSDWFTWDGWSYCFLCWEQTGLVHFEPQAGRKDFNSLEEIQNGPAKGIR
jgi:hypothetical protein